MRFPKALSIAVLLAYVVVQTGLAVVGFTAFGPVGGLVAIGILAASDMWFFRRLRRLPDEER